MDKEKHIKVEEFTRTYVATNDLPDRDDFTLGNKYKIYEEIVQPLSEGPYSGIYRPDSILYRVKNDDGEIIKVPYGYFTHSNLPLMHEEGLDWREEIKNLPEEMREFWEGQWEIVCEGDIGKIHEQMAKDHKLQSSGREEWNEYMQPIPPGIVYAKLSGLDNTYLSVERQIHNIEQQMQCIQRSIQLLKESLERK